MEKQDIRAMSCSKVPWRQFGFFLEIAEQSRSVHFGDTFYTDILKGNATTVDAL
jgi:hypothetical protein